MNLIVIVLVILLIFGSVYMLPNAAIADVRNGRALNAKARRHIKRSHAVAKHLPNFSNLAFGKFG